MKFAFIFLLSVLVLFLFFYFYPGYIFESKITGNGTELVIDLSLKNILHGEDLPTELIPENIESIRLTAAGFMILTVCLIGLPLMIAYRFSLKKKDEINSTDEQNTL